MTNEVRFAFLAKFQVIAPFFFVQNELVIFFPVFAAGLKFFKPVVYSDILIICYIFIFPQEAFSTWYVPQTLPVPVRKEIREVVSQVETVENEEVTTLECVPTGWLSVVTVSAAIQSFIYNLLNKLIISFSTYFFVTQ